MHLQQSRINSRNKRTWQMITFKPVSHRAYGLYGQARTVNAYGHPKICPRWGLIRSARTVCTVTHGRPYGLYGRSYGLYGQLLRSLRWAWPHEIFAQEQKTRTVSTVSTVLPPVCLRFLLSPDRRNRRLTGSKTVLTVLTVRVFFAVEQKFRTVRLTVETVATDRKDRRSWPYLTAVRSVRPLAMVSAVSCYGW